jgi:hypothetical protein
MSDALKKREEQLITRGLGTGLPFFPGLPSLDSAGLRFDPPKRKIGEISQGILSALEKGAKLTDKALTYPAELGQAAAEYLLSPSEFAKQQEQEKMDSITKSLSLDELFYPSGNFREDERKIAEAQGMRFDPVDLTEKIRDLTPSGPKLDRLAMDEEEKKDATQRTEEFREKEAEIAAAQGKPEVGGEALQKAAEAAEEAFAGGVQEYAKGAGIEMPPAMSKEESLEKYKQEFAKATGIDISGKVDKSSALMAMGLALMQNRAGKGFNVGRILSSVGEAGQAAMPALESARKEARAAQVAAGKYALEQVAAEKSAAAAFAKERRAANDAFRLKLMELSQKAMKDKAAGKELKNVGPNEIIQGVKINYGTSAGNTVLAKPSADAALVSNAWNKYTTGQNNINKLLTIAEELAETPAPAFKTFGDRVKRQLGNLGLIDPVISFGPDGASDEDKFNAMRLSVINEMKRLIIQESQVSDYDRKMLDASFGEINLTTTPQQTVFALNEMLNYFNGKKQNLVTPLEHMYDPDFYTSDEEYNRTIKYLQNSLDVPFVPPRARNEGGTTTTKPVANVDLTKAN